MIDKINNDNLLNTDNSLKQNQEVQGTQSVLGLSSKNAYQLNKTHLVDESDISQTALDLYQREQELSKYTAYLDNISEEEATAQVTDLMQKGVINVSDEELAESIFNNIPLLNELFN